MDDTDQLHHYVPHAHMDIILQLFQKSRSSGLTDRTLRAFSGLGKSGRVWESVACQACGALRGGRGEAYLLVIG